MNEVIRVAKIMEEIWAKQGEIHRLAKGTAKKMESIRVDTTNKEAVRETNEHILDKYSILVNDGHCYVSAVPKIQEDGSVCVVDDYGNKYGYDRLIPDGKYHIFASVEDVWAFHEAIEDLLQRAKEKGILKGVE